MKEYFTPGIVLERKPRGELDEIVTVYTKNLGKVVAFTKSSRKITSKLSGHLTPGQLANIRFVEKNKLQLVDILAVKSNVYPRELLFFLNFIDRMIPARDADLVLWYMIEKIVKSGRLRGADYRRLVEVMGFGGETSFCHNCGSRQTSYFAINETIFLCSRCRANFNLESDELVFLGEK